MRLRIGTRGSDLALWQARHVARLLALVGVESELVVLKTRGDLIDDLPLTKVEGKAFFTAEIERALLAREVDLAVHSHKDLPSEMTPGLLVAAVPERGAPHERLLIAPDAHDNEAAFVALRAGARVGTSAPRRAGQIATLRPDLVVLDLRGNVPRRVQRLREGRYDAIVLAAAGLDRLGLPLDPLIACDLSLDLFVPAPAQGALAVQVRATDDELIELCRRHLHDPASARAVDAERSLLSAAGGGCNLPLGASVAAQPDLRPNALPSPHFGGTSGAGGGVTRNPGSFRACAFLGAGHPATAVHGRWAVAVGSSPREALDAAFAQLATGAPTHCGPLAPLAVAVTGSASDGSVLGARLESLGARVVCERVIEFQPVPDPLATRTQSPASPTGVPAGLAVELASLREGDALAVTSRQTARFLEGLVVPRGVLVAAVGPASARALAEVGLRADVVGHGGARELATRLTLATGSRLLFPCAQDATDDLEREMETRGVRVQRLELYRTIPVSDVELSDSVDARVYTSPSAVAAALAWERARATSHAVRFGLGHTTAAALESAHLTAVRPRCSESGVVDELIRQLARLRAEREPHR